MAHSEHQDVIREKANAIRCEFRLLMNGVASQSMRQKGSSYHINWGIQLPQLKELATQYEKNGQLAIMLWKDDVRESKIMATLLMPHDEMLPDMMEQWMQQISNMEMVEMSVVNLFQYADSAPFFAYKWMASGNELEQYAGFLLIGRLFMQHREPNDRGIQEFLDQAAAAILSDYLPVRKAASTAVMKFADLGDEYADIAQKAMSSMGIPLF